jgi:hypothetical protein
MRNVRIAVTFALLTLLAASAFAQADTSSTNPAPGPMYSAGAFLGFNHYDNRHKNRPVAELARVPSSRHPQ